ncbi:MAG TPA: capsule assembly Wzi family protein [Bacteroidota bacterium]|nr:capsule assembly Wzi family protein [Bacteroidota bacterium]
MRQFRFLPALLSVFLLWISPLLSQSVSLPTTHEVYDFFKRVEARGILKDYRDATKPLARKDIARHLLSMDGRLNQLTEVERDTYEYLKSEFSYELGSLGGDPEPTDLRWHLLSLDLHHGVMNLDLNGQLRWDGPKEKTVRYRGQGLRFYGYAFNNVGFSFNFVDYREAGQGMNLGKSDTPDPGIVLTKATQSAMEYNTTEVQLSFQTGSFRFSLEKMQNVWGYGERGNVILSRKSPSYPQIKMRVPLSPWMDFVYVLADLNSNVIDSARSYTAYSSAIAPFFRRVDRQKYMAAHVLEFTVIDGLDFSLGESVIYSDKGIQLMYLIPVMFFKSGEHYNRDTDNIQWFGSVDINLVPRINFNLSVLIDELTTDDLLSPANARNQLGFTAGIHTYDLGIENLELIAEYTRMNPWVYSHKYPAATFTNNGYDLGHWVGQNADNLYFDARYVPIRPLRVGAFYERYRKGGLVDIAFQYRLPSKPFLYGPVHEERSMGLYGRYQFARDGFFDGLFRWRTVKDEAAPTLNKSNSPEFSVRLSYGIW